MRPLHIHYGQPLNPQPGDDPYLFCRECDATFGEEDPIVPWTWTWHYGHRVQVPGVCPHCQGDDLSWYIPAQGFGEGL